MKFKLNILQAREGAAASLNLLQHSFSGAYRDDRQTQHGHDHDCRDEHRGHENRVRDHGRDRGERE